MSDSTIAVSSDERIPEMHRYVVALLRRAPDRVAISEVEAERIQAGHLAHLERLRRTGDLTVAGTIEQESDLREVLVFREGPIERIRPLAEADPVVQRRRLVVELFEWTAPAGLRLGPAPRPEPIDEP